MRIFNPFSVWTQVTITKKIARAVRSIQYVALTYASGGVTATASVTAAVGNGKLEWLGENFAGNTAATANIGCTSKLSISGTTVTATRTNGADTAGNNVAGTVNAAFVDYA